MREEPCRLPESDMVIADLLVEYIGYECFQKVIRHVAPEYVSCVIQINAGGHWVSDSPYLHTFDGLEQVHCQVEETGLEMAMSEIGYQRIYALERGLPNEKKLLRMDFRQLLR